MNTSKNEELSEFRRAIDEIDSAIVPLFNKRMAISKKVAQIKSNQSWAVQDKDREAQVIQNALKLADDEFTEETTIMMRVLMHLSRKYQHRAMHSGGTVQSSSPASE